jgi:hypothetical protein
MIEFDESGRGPAPGLRLPLEALDQIGPDE